MWVRLTWPASKELFTFAYRRSLGEIYLQRDTSAYFAVIEAMQQERCIPPIGDSSRIFEPGCNVGAILREFQRRYDCLVVGLDISSDAIGFAREKVFKGNKRAEFYVGDVQDPGVLSMYPDNHFSHVFSVAHLVHVPNGPKKRAYIETLKRVGRCVVLYERIANEGDPMSTKRHMEDYETEYGFKLFRKIEKKHSKYPKFTGVFYHTKTFE